MSSPLAEAFFLWTILTVVMKHPLRFYRPPAVDWSVSPEALIILFALRF